MGGRHSDAHPISPAGCCWTSVSPLSSLPLMCTSARGTACSPVAGGSCLRRLRGHPVDGRSSVCPAWGLSAPRLIGTQADAGSIIFHMWLPGWSCVSIPPTSRQKPDRWGGCGRSHGGWAGTLSLPQLAAGEAGTSREDKK